jgi:hypothetical protein
MLIKPSETRRNPARTEPAYLSWLGLETKLLKPDHEQGEFLQIFRVRTLGT